ncbi:M66 family metalloprotease [Photobacterium leiognathi]|nr:M66 family metalloprotease [Photobacterium leiognathi]
MRHVKIFYWSLFSNVFIHSAYAMGSASPDSLGIALGEHSITCSALDIASAQPIWGTGHYTSDSPLCKAAVHAGVIPHNGGTAKYKLENNVSSTFNSSTRNGITSRSYGHFGKKYTFILHGSPASWGFKPDEYTFEPREYTTTCSASDIKPGLPVWGTGFYSSGSPLCQSAVHAGVIDRDGGTVTYILMNNYGNRYYGSTSNGITSWDTGNRDVKYTFTSTSSTSSAYTIFNNNELPSDLTGSLEASVSFAQSQIMPSKHGIEGDVQPYLTALRTSLLMVKPKRKLNIATPLRVTVIDNQGRNLGSMSLNPPHQLPKAAYSIDGVPEEELDFEPIGDTSYVINSSSESRSYSRLSVYSLNDPTAAFLHRALAHNDLVEINTEDSVWTSNIYLPNLASMKDKVVRVTSKATYSSTIHYSDRSKVIETGDSLVFKHINGQWVRKGEREDNTLAYAYNTWSVKLPPNWIQPGIKMQFTHGELSGDLNDIKVGAPTELLIHTIDIGMLTEPRDAFHFAKETSAHREYFQTVPVSRLTVSQYESLYLPEVMLPNGSLLTDFDPSTGGWHKGTMRRSIGKLLISHGIDNANYGINSSIAESESGHPFSASQLAAHNSRGNYENGEVTHGGSGGAGIVTLDASLGNEFSHEVGHNFGIGHFPGGFSGSIHRQADAVNSTWGWDSDLNMFITNMSSKKSNQSTCLDGECQAAFDGRKFGRDSMAGGAPMSTINRYTLYTPYTAAKIQLNLESKIVFSPDSDTGFRKWNPKTQTMEPYQHRVKDGARINASIKELSEDYLKSLFDDYSLVTIRMYNGNFKRRINVPQASESNKGRTITFNHEADWTSYFRINGYSVPIYKGLKTSYTSDGTTWNEGEAPDLMIAKVPTSFGIPVTTLVGYYDPKGILPSYIYPALHGSYGFTYSDDNESLSVNNCQLQVEKSNGQSLNFKLSDVRFSNSNTMNKFHVNIPESDNPKSAAIVCKGNTLTERAIDPVKAPLLYTVNGYKKDETYHRWGDYDRIGTIGDLYVYDNPYNGDKELFQLSGLASNGRYWYFPINKTNNRYWTYISDID